MYVIYYFLINVKTREETMIPFTNFIGEIGDIVYIDDVKYRITDYAEDYFDWDYYEEEPEDFCY